MDITKTEERTGKQKGRLSRYLLLIALLSAFCYITLNVWLLPYSVAFKENGVMTAGYLLYAVIGILFSTPAPFVSAPYHVGLHGEDRFKADVQGYLPYGKETQNNVDNRRVLSACHGICTVVWNTEREPVVYVHPRIHCHAAFCRNSRGDGMERRSSA